MACKCCEELYGNEPLLREQYLYVGIDAQDGYGELYIMTYTGSSQIRINFCPMCGEKFRPWSYEEEDVEVKEDMVTDTYPFTLQSDSKETDLAEVDDYVTEDRVEDKADGKD